MPALEYSRIPPDHIVPFIGDFDLDCKHALNAFKTKRFEIMGTFKNRLDWMFDEDSINFSIKCDKDKEQNENCFFYIPKEMVLQYQMDEVYYFCAKCGKFIQLFSIDKHGWNGMHNDNGNFLSREEKKYPLEILPVPGCGCYAIKERFVSIERLPEDGSSLDVSDIQNYFSGITFVEFCPQCNKFNIAYSCETS